MTAEIPATAAVKLLLVNLTDGVQVTFPLADEPIITTSDGTFTVETSAETVSVPISSVRNYELSELSDVQELRDTEIEYSISNDVISFTDITPGTPVFIYSTDGRQVAAAVASSEGANVGIGSLQPGIYIASYGAQSFRFIKK